MPDVEAEACAWAVRLDAGPLDDADRGRLEAWLAAGERRKGALLRAQAGLRLLDVAGASAANAPSVGFADSSPAVRGSILAPRSSTAQRGRWIGAERAETEGAFGAAARRSRGFRPWRIAAAAAVVAVAALLALAPLRGELRTDVGEQRRVVLDDGSVALINTDSRLGVKYAEHRRRIALAQGEAWFQVAHDKSRPFVVDAGAVHVQATGTAFSVRRQPNGVQVAVTEGAVRVWRDGRPGELAVAAGHAAFVPAGADVPRRAQTAPTEDMLAWRRGEIVLNGQTVEEAAQEFNRYNARKLVVDSSEAGRERIVGYFLIDQPEKFAAAAARMTGARLRQDGRSIVIENSQ